MAAVLALICLPDVASALDTRVPSAVRERYKTLYEQDVRSIEGGSAFDRARLFKREGINVLSPTRTEMD